LGPVKDAISNLEIFHKSGIEACEIEFTYGPYIKEEDGNKIGDKAKELGIMLSIHAPYFVNLNSKDEEKVKASKERILKCCEVASWTGAKRVIFHAGFYLGMDKQDVFEKIKKEVKDIIGTIKKRGWDVEICPELMGKKNVFGSIEEIGKLVRETGCGVCLDVAHVLARYNKYEFVKLENTFRKKKWHIHFSGIEYGKRREEAFRSYKKDWKDILNWINKLDKDIVLICESPNPVVDVIKGIKIWKDLK